MELGDTISSALKTVGVTPGRVSDWLGVEDCGCGERKEKLNQLSRWAKRVVRGKTIDAAKYLERIIDG